jgi:small redox-active disulfide protein 2
MKIEILGVGCKNCEALYQNALAAVDALDPDRAVTVSKTGDIDTFLKMGVFTTPALVIDGEVVSVGRVLTPAEITAHLQQR